MSPFLLLLSGEMNKITQTRVNKARPSSSLISTSASLSLSFPPFHLLSRPFLPLFRTVVVPLSSFRKAEGGTSSRSVVRRFKHRVTKKGAEEEPPPPFSPLS